MITLSYKKRKRIPWIILWIRSDEFWNSKSQFTSSMWGISSKKRETNTIQKDTLCSWEVRIMILPHMYLLPRLDIHICMVIICWNSSLTQLCCNLQLLIVYNTKYLFQLQERWSTTSCPQNVFDTIILVDLIYYQFSIAQTHNNADRHLLGILTPHSISEQHIISRLNSFNMIKSGFIFMHNFRCMFHNCNNEEFQN